MTHRPRPGDGSLPSGENPADRGAGRGPGHRPERPEKAAGQEPRLTADIMLIGSGWHQPEQPEDPPSPSAGPDGPGGAAGASDAAQAELAAAFSAGFTHHSDRDRAHRDPAHPDDSAHRGAGGLCGDGGPGAGQARGFAAGGVLDRMLPGAELAGHLFAARRAGVGIMSDGELCGAIAANRRMCSLGAEFELVMIAELDARRAGRPPR